MSWSDTFKQVHGIDKADLIGVRDVFLSIQAIVLSRPDFWQMAKDLADIDWFPRVAIGAPAIDVTAALIQSAWGREALPVYVFHPNGSDILQPTENWLREIGPRTPGASICAPWPGWVSGKMVLTRVAKDYLAAADTGVVLYTTCVAHAALRAKYAGEEVPSLLGWEVLRGEQKGDWIKRPEVLREAQRRKQSRDDKKVKPAYGLDWYLAKMAHECGLEDWTKARLSATRRGKNRAAR